jgi:ligand-binding sensor domain-containing protein
VTYASAIAVAPDGAVWFAGYGLARYDGSSVKKYSDQEGLPNMAPHCMAFAPDGSLWVGSAGGYVSHFDGSKFTNYSMADGIPEEHVEGIGVAPDGSVWIGTWGGFARFDGSTWQAFKEVNGIAVGRLSKNSIVIPSNGKVYIGTSMEGTFVYDGGNWTVYRNEMGSALEGGYGWGSDVAAIAPDGAIWFGSWGTGLARFDGSNWLHLSDKDGLVYNWVAALVIAPDGTLWIGTGKGLARLSPK